MDALPQILDWVLDGGNIGALVLAVYVGFRINKRLNRDEVVQANFPPHRHVNGSILYPDMLQPTPVEHLKGEHHR